MNQKIIDVLKYLKDGLNYEDENQLINKLYNALHLRREEAIRSVSPLNRFRYRAEEIFGLQYRVESGWRQVTVSAETDALIFERAGLYIQVTQEEITDSGNLRLPAIRDRFTPGFCALLSTQEPTETGTRIYLAVNHEHIFSAGKYLSNIIPKITDRFIIKALTNNEEYVRPDAFTIYVSSEDRDSVLRAVRTDKIQKLLNPRVKLSLFAKVEKPGISWMEGYAQLSSGEERARCIASALRSKPSWDMLNKYINQEFRLSGFDPDHPYCFLPIEGSHGN